MHDENAPHRKANMRLDARSVAKPANVCKGYCIKVEFWNRNPGANPNMALRSGLPTCRTLRQHHPCDIASKEQAA